MQESDRQLLEMRKQAGAEQKAYQDGEDSGYNQGVSDGVDAAYGRP
jgi:flagellar biosynthesis/type III secretory pathway protein FliH